MASDVTVQINDSSSYGSLGLSLQGDFRFPTLDPALYTITSVSASLSGDAGGAAWRTLRPNEVMSAGAGAGWQMGEYTPIGGLAGGGATTSGYSTVFSIVYLEILRDLVVPAEYLPLSSDLLAGSGLDAGGYVPDYFQIEADAFGIFAGVGPPYYPSELVFIANP